MSKPWLFLKRRSQTVKGDNSSRLAKEWKQPQFGLKEFESGKNPNIDIVAIHGIDGDRENSWTASNGVLWLRDLLPEKIPNARILAYGYDANTHGQEQLATQFMHEHAMNFISKLALFREETASSDRPIIFVAHSSGGLLLKSALIHSHLCNENHLKNHHAISQSTYGISFFGTPHQGSATAELARSILRISSFLMPTSQVLLQHLERDSEALHHQLAQYSAISGQFETKFFYETYDTYIAPRVSKRVVPRTSAVVPGTVNADAIGINKNHSNLVKFPSADDDDFRTVSAALSLMSKAAWQKMLEKVGRYKSAAKEITLTPSQQSALSNLLRVNAARFNADSRPRCLDGTRTDLLKTIMEWTEQEISGMQCRIFWLSGQAGTGKTTVSLTVAGGCQTKGRLGASFFFSRDHVERSDLHLVFPTLAQQLGIFHRPFQVLLAKVLEEDPDLIQMEPRYQFKKLIVEPVKSCDSFPTSTIVVIDALDECKDENPNSRMLSILSSHIHELPHLKFFITSRPEDHIRGGFNPLFSITQTVILHDIEESVVDADIEHYFRHEFSTTASLYPDLVKEDWPSDESIKSLVKKSGRLFIFAATAMHFILDRNYSDPPSQLTILLEQSSAGAPSSPFALLDQLYLQVLRQAFLPGTTPPHRLNLLRIILGTIVLLRDPLSPGALESLLGLKCGTVRTTLRHLHSVVVVPATDEEPIRLIHPSFFHFATSRCSDDSFRIDSSECHEQLGIACFKQMKELNRNICSIQDASKLNNEIYDLAERIKRYIPPALRYACRNWSFHLCNAGVNTLQGMLQEFCREKILYWIEALSLLGYLREGIRHLQDVSKVLNATFLAPPEDLLEALCDSNWFMADHFELISCASLQLYRSALPLSSPSSFLRKTFRHELDAGMQVLQGEWVQKSSWVTILRGSKGVVKSINISPDGRLIVSASTDEVRLWDRDTGTLLQKLDVGTDSDIIWAKFFPDGQRVLAGTSRYILVIWNVATGACLQNIQLGGVNLEKLIDCCTISPLFTHFVGSADSHIYIWYTSTGNLLKTLSGHSNYVSSVAFSPNHMLIASTSEDQTVRIWNVISGTALRTLGGHSSRVTTTAFSPDSNYIVSSSQGKDICLWDVNSGVCLKTLKGHTDWITSVAFSPDGARVISGSSDCTLWVWDVVGGEVLKTVRCSGWVENVGFSPDGTQYISSTYDTIYIWDAVRASNLDEFGKLETSSVEFLSDGTQITGSNSYNSIQHVWDGLTGTHLISLASANPVTPSADHRYLASRSLDKLCIWDIASRAIVWASQDRRQEYIRSVTFSLDSTRILSRSNHAIHIWDVASGKNLFTIHAPTFPPLSFSHDGSQIVSRNVRYDIPPHVRPNPVLAVLPTCEPSEQLKYVMKGEWIFATKGVEEERCVWIPQDWRTGQARQYSSSHGRVAIGSPRGLVLLDLSGIHLTI